MTTIILGSGAFSQSPYTVSTNGTAKYTTIQDAVDAAVLDGGVNIYIQPGTYTESIAWPTGLSVQGADTAENNVIIEGNQTFSVAAGNLEFRNINFNATTGVVFTENANGGKIKFYQCALASQDGSSDCVVLTDGDLIAQNTSITSVGGDSISNANASNVSLTQCIIVSNSASNLLLGGAGTSTIRNSSFVSAASDCIQVNSVAAVVDTAYSQYIASNSAFNFLASSTVTSTYDNIFASGSYIATGAAGTFEYSFETLTSSTDIDPNITAVALDTISAPGLKFVDVTASGNLSPGKRFYVSAGVVSLALPSASYVGDQIVVALSTGTSWTITQGAGQQITVGSNSSTLGAGGSLASNATGDAVTLTCIAANTLWQAESVIGNLTIV